MNEYKTTSLTISSICYSLLRTSAIGISITNMLYYSNCNAFISIIIGFILGFIPISIFLKLMDKYKSKNILELNKKLFGKNIGKFLNIVFALFIIFFTSITMWNLTDFLYTQFLNQTPTYIIGLSFIIPIIYINIKGINSIGKTSLILFYINILTLIFIIISLFFQIDYSNFLPIHNNISGILNGSYNFITYNVLPIFLITIIPKNKLRDENNLSKHIKIMYILSSLEIFITTCLIIGIFGINLSKTFAYPEYHILKRISIFSMLERIEAILSLTWVCGFFITISIGVYFIVETIKDTFNVRKKSFRMGLIYTISLSILIISELLFRNHTQAYNFFLKLFPNIMVIFILLIPFIIFIFLLSKKEE